MRHKQRGSVAIAGVALTAAVAGCGGQNARARQQDATARVVSVPWSLIAVDGRRVRILVADEGCNYVLDRAGVAQTPRHVRISVEDRVHPLPRGVFCSAEARAIRLTIRLRSPLGRRALLHAPVTRGLPI